MEKINENNWEEKFDEHFFQFSDNCPDRECEYSGDDRCFHSSENYTKNFIKSLITSIKEKKEYLVKYEYSVLGDVVEQKEIVSAYSANSAWNQISNRANPVGNSYNLIEIKKI